MTSKGENRILALVVIVVIGVLLLLAFTAIGCSTSPTELVHIQFPRAPIVIRRPTLFASDELGEAMYIRQEISRVKENN